MEKMSMVGPTSDGDAGVIGCSCSSDAMISTSLVGGIGRSAGVRRAVVADMAPDRTRYRPPTPGRLAKAGAEVR
jgi:hypothetical protein